MEVATDPDPFIYYASHDLRAPLMSVKGLLNLMKTDGGKCEEYLVHLEKSVNKLDQSVHDMIDYLQNAQATVGCEEIDFRTIAEESIHALKFMEGAGEVDINLSTQGDTTFYSDRRRMISIFTNIISNAIRYRDIHKKSFLKIQVTFNEVESKIILEDNGIGIDRAFHQDIFSKFFRVSLDQKGSGLGLYIVKNAVEKLGGLIRVHSAKGEGTTFSIEIPNQSSRSMIAV